MFNNFYHITSNSLYNWSSDDALSLPLDYQGSLVKVKHTIQLSFNNSETNIYSSTKTLDASNLHYQPIIFVCFYTVLSSLCATSDFSLYTIAYATVFLA